MTFTDDASATRVPVIAIDGPSASGKGAVAWQVSQALAFHYLDSGALYRLVALAAIRRGTRLDDRHALAALAAQLDARFAELEIFLDGEEVTAAIRSEAVGSSASEVAAIPEVRGALLARQRAFRQAPGLVAEGRDMGSTVFPDAEPKVFLTAIPAERAVRRYKQLKDKGMRASLPDILRDIQQRDARDSERSVAPLKMCADAILLDTTSLTIAQVVAEIVRHFQHAHGRH